MADNHTLSIPPRWLHCPRKGQLIAGKFLPFKTLLDSRYNDQVPEECRFDPQMLFLSLKSLRVKMGLLIDLTNTNRFYDKTLIDNEGCKYLKLQCRGHGESPAEEQVKTFVNVCDHFIRQHPLEIIGIHCTHGFNRTGFLIIAYLVENMDWSVDAACRMFGQLRPPGIYKEDYIQDLFSRYGDIEDAPPAPALPDWEERKNFIRAKYERKRYAIITCTNQEDRKSDLKQAVVFKDIYALLQVYAEGINFMEPLPDMPKNQTALHLAIEEEDNRSLYMVDFMTQNSNAQSLIRADRDGNNCLHYCAQLDRTECMKLLLRVQPDLVNYENKAGETPLEIARDSGNELCVELINSALAGKTDLFNNVNIDWGLVSDDHSYDDVDYSDDDLDKVQTPDRKSRSRPGSLVMSSDQSLPMSIPSSGSNRERSLTVDSFKSSTLPKEIIMGPPPDRSGNNNKAKQSLILPSGLSGSTQSLVTSTLQRKKAPAPPPPTYRELQRHSRKHSDPGFGSTHCRSPSDPPPLPDKVNRQGSPNTKTALPGDPTAKMRRRSYAGIFFPSGAKLVLPPPPEFRSNDSSISERPALAPKPSKSNPIAARKQSSQSSSDDYIILDTQQHPHSASIDTASRKANLQIAMEAKSVIRQQQGELMTNSVHNIHTKAGYSHHSNGNNHHHTSSSTNINVDQPYHHHHSGNFVTMDIRNSNMTQSANFNGHRTIRDRGGSTDSQGSSSSREGILNNENPSPQVFQTNARCRALYDCDADNEDELSFKEGDILIVVKEEEEEWWEGYIEGFPARTGMFPKTFVEILR